MPDDYNTVMDQLLPRSPEESVDYIRKVLRNERHMRLQVFADDDRKRQAKVAEIDEALRCVANVERALKGGEW